jgi:hypothetical protein
MRKANFGIECGTIADACHVVDEAFVDAEFRRPIAVVSRSNMR